MFDLSKLNDFEFESLCRDIMQEKLGIKLYCYSRGVDGGVDICDGKVNPYIVIQAKHYLGSRYDQLFRQLKKEVSKVNSFKPKKYYVFTSLSLTKKNKDEIVSLFSKYMVDESHVIDKIEIDSFLAQEKNKELVAKHYKLWLCSTSTLSLLLNQNIFFDCSELIDDIKRSLHVFVNTFSFFAAKEILYNNNILIITGAPGVGKSVISKMLVLSFVSDGYVVRYATDNNIADIKRVLSQEPTKREVILLDDFLGQHYLNMKSSQPSELKTLISFIDKSKSKKLILNSRITIMREAVQSSLVFREIMQKYIDSKYVINLDEMSKKEKAQILYNHLYFAGLPDTYFIAIKNDKNYEKIVNHSNYNPRIIEYITKKENIKLVESQDYVAYVFDKLNNPEDVWKDEFRNRISDNDRILVDTIYSLTNSVIDIAVLEKSFNKRIRSLGSADTSINLFRESIVRLTESLIKIVISSKNTFVSVINPSVNDYIRFDISINSNEQISIIKSAIYIEQIVKLSISDDAKELVKNMILDGSLLSLKVLANSPFFYYIKLLIEYELLDNRIKEDVSNSIKNMHNNLTRESKEDYAEMIIELLSSHFYEFYGLGNIFIDIKLFSEIIQNLNANKMAGFVSKILAIANYEYGEWWDEWVGYVREIVKQRLFEIVQIDTEESLSEIISNCMDEINGGKQDEYYNEINDEFEKNVRQNIEEYIFSFVGDYIDAFGVPLDLKVDDFLEMEHYDFNVRGIFNEMYEEMLSDRWNDYDDDDRKSIRSDSTTDTNFVRSLFER